MEGRPFLLERLIIDYMTMNLQFESRTGKLSCTTAEVFGFITNIKNFEQFIPAGNIKNWQASADSCSFQVPPLGTVSVSLTEKIAYSFVAYSGDALQKNDFKLIVHISENEKKLAEVRLFLTAELNPFLKMMASGPIEKFLETMISEMEKFEKWNVISKES
jgi:carbon monoxide dehydrogenase subunit G